MKPAQLAKTPGPCPGPRPGRRPPSTAGLPQDRSQPVPERGPAPSPRPPALDPWPRARADPRPTPLRGAPDVATPEHRGPRVLCAQARCPHAPPPPGSRRGAQARPGAGAGGTALQRAVMSVVRALSRLPRARRLALTKAVSRHRGPGGSRWSPQAVAERTPGPAPNLDGWVRACGLERGRAAGTREGSGAV